MENINSTLKGLVFNIQRYSIHDGTGIRTVVFFKGCPLKCPWCANPESRLAVKPTTWRKNGQVETIGKWLTVSEVVDEVMKDEVFFRTSGGGVTLSGGEVLMQSEFARLVLKELTDLGIHTALETTGCFPKEHLLSLAPYLNEVLFDLKIMIADRAKEVIGINVDVVKENFEAICSVPEITVIPRIPLIPDYTVDSENIGLIIDYLKMNNIKQVHLLPFHQYGSNKYEYLGWEYQMKDAKKLSAESLDLIYQTFKTQKISPVLDGLA